MSLRHSEERMISTGNAIRDSNIWKIVSELILTFFFPEEVDVAMKCQGQAPTQRDLFW